MTFLVCTPKQCPESRSVVGPQSIDFLSRLLGGLSMTLENAKIAPITQDMQLSYLIRKAI